MIVPATLLALALSLVATPAAADAVVVTRAMTANTIMEAFVEDERIVVELEVSDDDETALRDLIAGASSAPNLPVPVSANAGLSIQADGRRLKGTVEQIERRKRIERDEVSGEPLPSAGTENVVFLKLNYPLRTQPEQLIFEPPLTADGYAAVDIGFVVYHRGIAVNDFRYLATGEPLHLDWEDPFYSRFDRRTLNRKYSSPMNIFLYVEPFEVRKEFVVRPLDLARFMDIDIEAHKPIPADQRTELLGELAAFLKDRARVTIDGEQPDPILDRIHFLQRGLRMTRVVTPDEPVDGTSAIIGAIFVYPVDGIPKDVRLTWDLFDDRITRVPASATDEAGPMPSFLTPDDAELHWVNYLKGSILPGELEVRVPQSHISVPLAVLVAVLGGIALLIAAVRRRSWVLGLAAVMLAFGGWLAQPMGGALYIAVPASIRTPSGDEVRPTLHALLYNVYRALDFREEEVVFDRLAQSLSGDVLERVYLEMRKGLRLESQGGARVRVRAVEVLDVTPAESEEPSQVETVTEESTQVETLETLRYRARWNATGTVGHWGHTHMRTNSYDALVTLGRIGSQWKIADIDILEEERILPNQR
jgi:hypothetical protein